MDNLISRLSELRSQYNCFDENERDAYHTLSEAIEALQQKTGTWIKDEFGSRCSNCGLYAYRDKFDKPWESDFCPNCGARMEGEEE